MPSLRLYISAIVGIATLGACSSTEPLPQSAEVRFVLDAPLCSSIMPVTFSIDSVVVGTDTFRVHLPPNHTESKAFTVSPGNHVLGARTTGVFSYVWRDTVVKATAGAATFDTLPFYCS